MQEKNKITQATAIFQGLLAFLLVYNMVMEPTRIEMDMFNRPTSTLVIIHTFGTGKWK